MAPSYKLTSPKISHDAPNVLRVGIGDDQVEFGFPGDLSHQKDVDGANGHEALHQSPNLQFQKVHHFPVSIEVGFKVTNGAIDFRSDEDIDVK